jgi:hypothetical protein
MVQGLALGSHRKRSQSSMRRISQAFLAIAVFMPYVFRFSICASAQQSPAAPSAETLPSFEVASIKPSRPDYRGRKLHPSGDRITIENFTLKELITYAYDLKDNSQVLGGPDWLDKTHFDIDGVVGEAEVAKLHSMSANDQRLTIRERNGA